MSADSQVVEDRSGSASNPVTRFAPKAEIGRIYHFEQLGPYCVGYRFDVEAFRRATPAQLRAELDDLFRGDT